MPGSLSVPEPSRLLSFEEIDKLTDEQLFEEIRKRGDVIRNSFLEIGKMIVALKKRHGEDFKHYGFLKNVFDHGTLSNAGYAEKVWTLYVEPGVVTEQDFEKLTFSQCRALTKSSKAGQSPEVAVLSLFPNYAKGNSAAELGRKFENYVFCLLKARHADFSWTTPRGPLERGLDFIGNYNSPQEGIQKRIGVQVKFHAATAYPTEQEWLRFLAGCFMRRVDLGLFVTTGKLTGEQGRQAHEAGVEVWQGREEINRVAKRLDLPPCPD